MIIYLHNTIIIEGMSQFDERTITHKSEIKKKNDVVYYTKV